MADNETIESAVDTGGQPDVSGKEPEEYDSNRKVTVLTVSKAQGTEQRPRFVQMIPR